MRRYRQAIIFLLFSTWIFFNIERIDFGARKDLINMKYYFYILALASSVIILSIKQFSRLNVYFSIGIVLCIWLVFNLYDNPYESILRGGIYTYLAITEITFLTIVILLSRHLANLLNDLENTIEHISLVGTSGRVKQFSDSKEEIDIEVYRSRRNNSELSLLLVDVDHVASNIELDQTIKEFQATILQHYNLIRLARLTSRSTRRADIILLNVDEHFIAILAPDTNKENAEKLSAKIRQIAKAEYNMDIDIGVRTMPNDAKTFEELYAKTKESIDN